MERILLRVTEAAETLGISRSKAYEMIAAGELPAIRLRGSIRIVHADLERMIEAESRVGPSHVFGEFQQESGGRVGPLQSVRTLPLAKTSQSG